MLFSSLFALGGLSLSLSLSGSLGSGGLSGLLCLALGGSGLELLLLGNALGLLLGGSLVSGGLLSLASGLLGLVIVRIFMGFADGAFAPASISGRVAPIASVGNPPNECATITGCLPEAASCAASIASIASRTKVLIV